MRKLLPSIFAALLITPLVGGSAYAAFGMHGSGPAGTPNVSGSGPRSGGGAVSGGGGGFRGGAGGGFRGGAGGGFRGGADGGFVGRPGGNFRDGTFGGGTFNGGNWRGGDWRYRRGFRGNFGVVFADPWYDPFWPYGYGFGWGYGWYGPPYYAERRVTEYAEPPVDYGPPPEQYWYYCGDPDGYYPYVQSCNRQWQPVPVTPPGGPQGAPQNGAPPRSSALPESRSDGG